MHGETVKLICYAILLFVKIGAVQAQLYWGVQINIYKYFANLLSDFDEIRYKRPAQSADEHLCVSWQSDTVISRFLHEHAWNYIYTGNLQTCNILKVKNALAIYDLPLCFLLYKITSYISIQRDACV